MTEYQNEDDTPLKNYPEMTRREVAFLSENEKVIHLDDLILRRSLMAYLGHLNRPLIDEMADILAEVLDWTTEKKQAQIERTLEILLDKHGVSL